MPGYLGNAAALAASRQGLGDRPQAAELPGGIQVLSIWLSDHVLAVGLQLLSLGQGRSCAMTRATHGGTAARP